jgi:hypothetical protein
MRKAVNNHGVRLAGIRRACTETRWLTREAIAGGCRVQVLYDTEHGLVMARYCAPGEHHVPHDPGVISVCMAYAPMTMQDISDAVATALGLHYNM